MSSQFSYDGVAQGTAVLLDKSPNGYDRIGTDGIAICLGVHILVQTDKGAARFVAHFDCEAEPKGTKDPLFQKMADWVANWMAERFNEYDPKVHQDLEIFSGGTFASTMAVQKGIAQWSGQPKLQLNSWLGFWVPYGKGSPAKIPDGRLGQILAKEWDCTVPKNPA